MDRFWFWLAAHLPRRLMYHVINRMIIDGQKVHGDRWLFSLHKLGNLRSEYGGMGSLGRKRVLDIQRSSS